MRVCSLPLSLTPTPCPRAPLRHSNGMRMSCASNECVSRWRAPRDTPLNQFCLLSCLCPLQRRRGIFGLVGGDGSTSGGAVRSKLRMRRIFRTKPPPGPGLCCQTDGMQVRALNRSEVHLGWKRRLVQKSARLPPIREAAFPWEPKSRSPSRSNLSAPTRYTWRPKRTRSRGATEGW